MAWRWRAHRVIVHQELLRHQLLQTVGILRLCGPGIVLLEAGGAIEGLVELLVLGVDAGGGGVPEALDTGRTRRLRHVERDHRRVVQDARVVGLDEAHAAHVGGEVEAPLHALARLLAGVGKSEVEVDELVAEHVLRHVLVLLPVHRAHPVPLLLETLGEVRADEASCTGNEDLGALFEVLGEAGLLNGGENHPASVQRNAIRASAAVYSQTARGKVLRDRSDGCRQQHAPSWQQQAERVQARAAGASRATGPPFVPAFGRLNASDLSDCLGARVSCSFSLHRATGAEGGPFCSVAFGKMPQSGRFVIGLPFIPRRASTHHAGARIHTSTVREYGERPSDPG